MQWRETRGATCSSTLLHETAVNSQPEIYLHSMILSTRKTGSQEESEGWKSVCNCKCIDRHVDRRMYERMDTPGESLVGVCMLRYSILLFLFHSLSLFLTPAFSFAFLFHHYRFVSCIIFPLFHLTEIFCSFTLIFSGFPLSLSFPRYWYGEMIFSFSPPPTRRHETIIFMISVWLAGLFVCVFNLFDVCLYVCYQDYRKSYVWLFTKFLQAMDLLTGNEALDFGTDPDLNLHPGYFCIIVYVRLFM